MQTVAVLFARSDSNYKTMPGCDVYDIDRDARTFAGGLPVIGHPPCRAWGRLRQFAKVRPDEKALAPWAVEQVRAWGGCWNTRQKAACSTIAGSHTRENSPMNTVGGRLKLSSSTGAIGRKNRLGYTSSDAAHQAYLLSRCAPADQRIASGRPKATHGFHRSPRPSANTRRQRLLNGSSNWRTDANHLE